MENSKPIMVPTLVSRDVNRVKEQAVFILEIRGREIVEKRNPKPTLNLIAIIGPGEAFGKKFDEALLCEIGIGKTRPYNPSHGIYGHKSSFAKRRHWFNLTKEQFLLVSPHVFHLLQKLTDERVSRWKCKDGFYIKTSHNFCTSRNHNRLYRNSSHVLQPKGCRFSVSFEDDFFLQDVLSSELNSIRIRNNLRGFAHLGDKLLSEYKSNGYCRCFSKLKKVRQFAEIADEIMHASVPPYIFVELLKFWPKGMANPLYEPMRELVGKLSGFPELDNPQLKLTRAVLPGMQKRMGNISLRTISELKPRNGKRNYVVFEVMPQEDCPF